MHWPKVSRKKKQELESLKESLSPYRNKKSPKSIIGSENPKIVDVMSNTEVKTGNNRANSENDGEKSSVKRKKIIWPENPLKPKQKDYKEPIIVDWLKERRIK